MVLSLVAPLSSFVAERVHGVALGYTDVTVTEAKVMIDTNPFLVLLDVRNQSEYDAGHIRNARLIPVWEFAARLNELNKTDEILVYCMAGGRSANASQTLADSGFLHVYNMLGGITDWTGKGYPVYVKYPLIQEAINNTTDGGIVYVSSGLYNEYLFVNRSIALVGENGPTTILNGTSTILNVNVDNVQISDFTIRHIGCACYGYSAVNITNSQDTNVTNNIIVSDDFGIRVVNARRVIIAQNTIAHTGDPSIVVLDSSEISVLGNSIEASDGIEVDTTTESIFSRNAILSSRGAGIFTYASNENTFSSNNVSVNSSTAISIAGSHNNTFFGNNVSSNGPYRLFSWQSSNNSFFHNNFLGTTGQVSNYDSTNFWDNGFEGNFWSSYTGVDADPDGLGDTPFVIDSTSASARTNKDNCPLMGLFHSFDTTLDYDVDIVSNSTISGFEYLGSNRTIKLQVSNTTANQTIGFCRISIPHSLIDPINGSISAVIDDGLTPILFLNSTLYDNGTHRWIYFTYPHSTHEILIVPEFPIIVMLPLFMIAGVIATATCKRRRRARSLKTNQRSREIGNLCVVLFTLK